MQSTKQNDFSSIEKIKVKMKALTKAEKLQKDIEYVESIIERDQTKYDNFLKLTDEEILQTSLSYKYLVMPFSEVNVGSPIHDQYKNDIPGYDLMRQNDRKEYIERCKMVNDRNIGSIKDNKKKIEWIKLKIAKVLQD